MFDYVDRTDEFLSDLSGWMDRREIVFRETLIDGIERAPEAFVGLFKGDSIGKMLVKL